MACASVSASVRQTALASQVLLPFSVLSRPNGWVDSIVPARFGLISSNWQVKMKELNPEKDFLAIVTEDSKAVNNLS